MQAQKGVFYNFKRRCNLSFSNKGFLFRLFFADRTLYLYTYSDDMSGKNKKQFGVWLDSNHATVVGREPVDTGDFAILAEAKNEGQGGNSNENTANNAEQTLQKKFFKEITAHMPNAEEVHITGTGISQEQFIHFMAETAQFKNTVTLESTSNKMGNEKLIGYISEKFN